MCSCDDISLSLYFKTILNEARISLDRNATRQYPAIITSFPTYHLGEGGHDTFPVRIARGKANI